MALDPDVARCSVCYLETIGRSSRLPREIEIWFAADPVRDRIHLLSGGGDRAHWVRNVQRDPSVRVRIGKRWFTGRTVDVTGDPDEVTARQLVGGKYGCWGRAPR